MTSNSLNGQWAACQVGKSDSVPATVPGCIHTALLAAGGRDLDWGFLDVDSRPATRD
jgi:hypothetical protein